MSRTFNIARQIAPAAGAPSPGWAAAVPTLAPKRPLPSTGIGIALHIAQRGCGAEFVPDLDLESRHGQRGGGAVGHYTRPDLAALYGSARDYRAVIAHANGEFARANE